MGKYQSNLYITQRYSSVYTKKSGGVLRYVAVRKFPDKKFWSSVFYTFEEAKQFIDLANTFETRPEDPYCYYTLLKSSATSSDCLKSLKEDNLIANNDNTHCL